MESVNSGLGQLMCFMGPWRVSGPRRQKSDRDCAFWSFIIETSIFASHLDNNVSSCFQTDASNLNFAHIRAFIILSSALWFKHQDSKQLLSYTSLEQRSCYWPGASSNGNLPSVWSAFTLKKQKSFLWYVASADTWFARRVIGKSFF